MSNIHRAEERLLSTTNCETWRSIINHNHIVHAAGPIPYTRTGAMRYVLMGESTLTTIVMFFPYVLIPKAEEAEPLL